MNDLFLVDIPVRSKSEVVTFSSQPLLGTPRTPRNATPEIPRRSHAAQKPTSVLEEARLR